MKMQISDIAIGLLVGIAIGLFVAYKNKRAPSGTINNADLSVLIRAEVKRELDALRSKKEKPVVMQKSNAPEGVKDLVERELITYFNYSLSMVYDEKENLGHYFTYKVEEEDGHWVTVKFNKKTDNFVAIHHRTHENVLGKSYEARERDDLSHNSQHIFGSSNRAGSTEGMMKESGIFVPRGKSGVS
jgi:hypothetical protein